jgi:hypothetical protein
MAEALMKIMLRATSMKIGRSWWLEFFFFYYEKKAHYQFNPDAALALCVWVSLLKKSGHLIFEQDGVDGPRI